MVKKYGGCFRFFLRADNAVYFDGQLRAVEIAFSASETDYERTARAGDVPWIYEHDRRIFHSKSHGLDRFPACAGVGVFG